MLKGTRFADATSAALKKQAEALTDEAAWTKLCENEQHVFRLWQLDRLATVVPPMATAIAAVSMSAAMMAMLAGTKERKTALAFMQKTVELAFEAEEAGGAEPMPFGPEALAAIDSRCSFCSRSRSEVGKIVAGRSAFICIECATLCASLDSVPAARA